MSAPIIIFTTVGQETLTCIGLVVLGILFKRILVCLLFSFHTSLGCTGIITHIVLWEYQI